MIITLKKDAPKEQAEQLLQSIRQSGLQVVAIEGIQYDVLGVVGDTTCLDEKLIGANEFVYSIQRVAVPFKKADRAFHQADTIVQVGRDACAVRVGQNQPIAVIGGPCSVESEQSTLRLASAVKTAGCGMLRGGVFKPRTSPYAFQGVGCIGLEWLKRARTQYQLPIVSEIMSTDTLDAFVQDVDLIQVGARNMQNYDLLKALGKVNKPILLKRGLASTIEEWIMSAEYIMAGGNEQIILCERGVRTFEKYTRNSLDLSVIPIIKQKTHLPIIVDPSHATGDWRLVEAMSLAAIAAGVDGLMIEVHDCPECAKSDGAQSLKPEKLAALMQKGKRIAQVLGRQM